jgi:hypothetical protein
MAYKDKTYIIFDGDKDKWAYANMKGWKALEHIDFDFENAHDIATLTNNASGESYIKGKLKERFATACQVIVLIGESTKFLYRYVRWELQVAQSLNLPIFAVNINNDRKQNNDTCPPIIRGTYDVHIPFKMKIIKYALDQFPTEFKNKTSNMSNGGRHYPDSVYQELGLN